MRSFERSRWHTVDRGEQRGGGPGSRERQRASIATHTRSILLVSLIGHASGTEEKEKGKRKKKQDYVYAARVAGLHVAYCTRLQRWRATRIKRPEGTPIAASQQGGAHHTSRGEQKRSHQHHRAATFEEVFSSSHLNKGGRGNSKYSSLEHLGAKSQRGR